MNEPSVDDLDLLHRYRESGDPEAFALLVERHQIMVLGVCRRIMSGSGLDEDAMQETFLRLALHAGQVRRNLGAWLHRTATNAALALLRTEHRCHRRQRHAAAEAPEPAAEEEEQQQKSQDLWRQADEAMAALPDDARELLVRHYLEGSSQSALAASLGVSQPVVHRRLVAALARLRRQLRVAGPLPELALALAALSHEPCTVSAAVTRKCKLAGLTMGRSAPAAGRRAFPWGVGIALGLSFIVGAWVWHQSRGAAYPAAVSTPQEHALCRWPGAAGGLLLVPATPAAGRPGLDFASAQRHPLEMSGNELVLKSGTALLWDTQALPSRWRVEIVLRQVGASGVNLNCPGVVTSGSQILVSELQRGNQILQSCRDGNRDVVIDSCWRALEDGRWEVTNRLNGEIVERLRGEVDPHGIMLLGITGAGSCRIRTIRLSADRPEEGS